MPDDTLSQLIVTVPNLAIAVWSLWWSYRRMDKMIEMHERLIEKLVTRLSVEDTQELKALTEDARKF